MKTNRKQTTLLLYLSFFLFSFTSLDAQVLSVAGRLLDKENSEPLIGAHIMLYREANDTMLQITTTNDYGFFHFELSGSGKYIVKSSYVGYESVDVPFLLWGQPVRLGTIYSVKEQKQLEEVDIVGQVPAAVQIGDTTQYNADAYKTAPDATAEDLASKMPGIVVEDNKVQAQGEDVKEVTVDGRPFFGNDPVTALRTLPAEVVDKIQVFDKQSDQSEFTGFDDGETTKTMNIITRRNMRNGQFGKGTVSAGLPDKYFVGGNYNIFKGTRRISLLGQSNNINVQNFSQEDLLGVMSSGRGGGPMGGGGGGMGSGGGMPGGDMGSFMVGQSGGISTTHALGINYSDQLGKKVEVAGSYFFSLGDNITESSLERAYLLGTISGQEYVEKSSANSKNINHRFNMKFEWNLNDRNEIMIRPSFSFQQNNKTSDFSGITYTADPDTTLLNETTNIKGSDLSGYSFNNTFLFRHKFEKERRTLTLNIRTSLSDRSGDGSLYSLTDYYSGTESTELIDQLNTTLSSGRTFGTTLTYTEPFTASGILQINYSASYQDNASDKRSYDYSDLYESYSVLDTLLSNSFNNNYLTQQGGAGIQIRKGDFFFNTGLSYQLANLANQQVFPYEYELVKPFSDLLANAMLRYSFTNKTRLSFSYRTTTDLPSVSQLQEVADISNPLMVSTGNQDLSESYMHMVSVRFSSINPETSRVFMSFINFETGRDYIGNSVFVASADTLFSSGLLINNGSQLTQPVNLDGYMSIRSFITYGLPLIALKSNLNFNISGSYKQTPGLINDELNLSGTLSGSLGVVISSNISENVDFTISSRSSANRVSNSLDPGVYTSYFDQNTRGKVKIVMLKKLVLESELLHQVYSGLSESYNQGYLLLNCGAGLKLFRNQRGELKLTVYDLLNQNRSIQRTVTDIYTEDSQTLVLQRYFLLSFTYNLRNFAMGGGERRMPGGGMMPMGPPDEHF